MIFFCPNSRKPHRHEHRIRYSSMANPELNRDGICRNQPTAVLWQKQISDSGPRSHELEFQNSLGQESKERRHRDNCNTGRTGQTSRSMTASAAGQHAKQVIAWWQERAQPPRLDLPSSWWTFSWPASSEICHHRVRVINRSGYTPERAVQLQLSEQISSDPPWTRESSRKAGKRRFTRAAL